MQLEIYCDEVMVYRLFVSIKPLSSPKNLGEILVPIYRTQRDLVKHSRQKSLFKRQNTVYHRSSICSSMYF